MYLPITIGKTSGDEERMADLMALPHLFISYTNEEQVITINNHLLSSLNRLTSPEIIAINILSTREFVISGNYPYKIRDNKKKMPDNPLFETSSGSPDIISIIYREFKQRCRLLEEYNCQSILELNTILVARRRKKKKIPFIVVIIQDVFYGLFSKKNKNGLKFIELLLSGDNVGIHMAAISQSSFRSLMTQLINLDSSIEVKIKIPDNNIRINKIRPLGAELIFTAEGLIFFKERSKMDFERLFPLS